MILRWIEALRSNMKALKRVLIGFLVVLIGYDLLLPRDAAHAHYFIDRIPAYWTAFSVVGCFLLIKIGKGIAHLFLSKDTNYYG
jgi:hypothetical protein